MKTNLHTRLFSTQKTAELKESAFCSIWFSFLIIFLFMSAHILASPGIIANSGTNNAFENLPPVAVCRSTPLTIYLDQSGTAGFTASQLDGGSYDPEHGPVTFLTRALNYSCSDIGPHEVTLIVLDDMGQSDECTTTVIVADNIPPIARCKDITILPDDKGDYTLLPSDVESGSTDNCGIMSMLVSPSFVPCVHQSVQQMVTLSVTDSSGNTGTCTSYVIFLGDSDCDGVGDFCDQCPGGNDQIDNNNDGLPDCAIFPGKSNIPVQWYCGNKCNQKVLICHIPPGNPENRHTICVSINAVPAHLAHGDYLGPCDETKCDPRGNDTRSAEVELGETDDVRLYPNPAISLVYLDFKDHAGSPATVAIYNNFGWIVFSRRFDVLPEGQFSIPLGKYPEGLYFVRIDGNDFSKLMKLHVNR
jgi:hypothetical protein